MSTQDKPQLETAPTQDAQVATRKNSGGQVKAKTTGVEAHKDGPVLADILSMKEQELKQFDQVSKQNQAGFKQNSYQATSLKGNRLT